MLLSRVSLKGHTIGSPPGARPRHGHQRQTPSTPACPGLRGEQTQVSASLKMHPRCRAPLWPWEGAHTGTGDPAAPANAPQGCLALGTHVAFWGPPAPLPSKETVQSLASSALSPSRHFTALGWGGPLPYFFLSTCLSRAKIWSVYPRKKFWTLGNW